MISMKRLAPVIVAAASVTAACSSDGDDAAQQQPSGCKVDVAGRYGFVLNGTDGPEPFVAGGVLDLRKDGTFAITGKQSLNGKVAAADPNAGKFTLDENCRGAAVDGAGDRVLEFSPVGDGNELRIIRTDQGSVTTGMAKRAATDCTDANVAGSFGYAFNALVYLNQPGFPQGASPFAGGGVVAVDDKAQLSLTDTASIGGQITPRKYQGKLTVKADCTGTAAVTLPAGAPTSANPVNVDVVWVDGRSEALIIQNDSGTFIAGSARRQALRGSGGCPKGNVAGRYGFVADGNSGGKPFVSGGTFELADGGGLTLSGRQSINGEVGPASPSAGTWTIDQATCTGTAVLADGSPMLAFSAVGDGQELRFIQTQAGKVITGTAKRAATGCTASNVVGGYGYAFNAIVFLNQPGFPTGPSPFAGGGVVTVSGDGKAKLVDSASIAGQIRPRNYSGTVTVNDNCTGAAAVNLPAGAPTSANPVNVDVVWVEGRAEAMLIQTNPGTFIAGAARRQTFK
jgi:hypothetical protein